MSCLIAPATTLTEDQEQLLIIRGAKVSVFPPALVANLSIPLICLGTPILPQLDPIITVTDTNGVPQPGITVSIGSQIRVTNANGQAGFSIVNTGQLIVLVLTVVDRDGNLRQGLSVSLGSITRITDVNGQVTFNINPLGVVT